MGGEMSYWNPDFTDHEEVLKAHRTGRTVAIAFSLMVLLGAAVVFFTDTGLPGMGEAEDKFAAVAGILVEAFFALFVAWRFHVGKGAFTGALLLLIVLLEIVFKLMSGSVAGIFISAIIVVGLFHAVRAAFDLRSSPPDMAETFE